jgi:phytoene desaturase
VTIVERVRAWRNGTLERDGFRFDTGPTVFTMVPLLEEVFRPVGRSFDDYLTMRLLDPAYHAFFADGSVTSEPATSYV